MQRLDEQSIDAFRRADLSCTIQDQRYLIIRDRIRSVIGGGSNIHIFGFTNREKNQFQKKLMRQYPNILIWLLLI